MEHPIKRLLLLLKRSLLVVFVLVGRTAAILDVAMLCAVQNKGITLSRHFFLLLTPPSIGALNIPEVKNFTGNCFRMVRRVLKITFLKLRYPKGVTGRLPLCPIMALRNDH